MCHNSGDVREKGKPGINESKNVADIKAYENTAHMLCSDIRKTDIAYVHSSGISTYNTRTQGCTSEISNFDKRRERERKREREREREKSLPDADG